MVSCNELQKSIDSLSKLLMDSVDELKGIIQENKNELLEKISIIGTRVGKMEDRLSDIEVHLDSSNERLIKVENASEQNVIDIKNIEERICLLEKDCTILSSVPANIKVMEEKLEDRTNRQLRETLIIRNVPEAKADESYDDTKACLAKIISDNLEDVSYDSAYKEIKRAHRESPRLNSVINYRKGKRNIFAALYSWDFCEKVKSAFRYKCIRDKNFNIYVDQKYGPLTTQRRKLAYEKRKELMSDGSIVGGFVSFPAKLMVYRGENDSSGRKDYKLHSNFSRVDVKY